MHSRSDLHEIQQEIPVKYNPCMHVVEVVYIETNKPLFVRGRGKRVAAVSAASLFASWLIGQLGSNLVVPTAAARRSARQDAVPQSNLPTCPALRAHQIPLQPDLGIWVGWRQAVANSEPAVALNLEVRNRKKESERDRAREMMMMMMMMTMGLMPLWFCHSQRQPHEQQACFYRLCTCSVAIYRAGGRRCCMYLNASSSCTHV